MRSAMAPKPRSYNERPLLGSESLLARLACRGCLWENLVDERRAIPVAISLLAVLASLFSGCATSPEAGTAEVERHAQQSALILAKRTDADSLAAAGLLRRGGLLSKDRHPDRSLSLLAQAAADDGGLL